MKFAAIYSFIGLAFLMFVVTFGNLIGKCKEKGCSTISIIIGCISVIIVWPYYVYIGIRKFYRSYKD